VPWVSHPTGGQGTLIVLYRQTSFGTLGGGPAANIACPCANICGTSVVKICIMSGENVTPGGSGGSGSPPGSIVVPGGNAVPGGNTIGGAGGGGGGAGTSMTRSIRRTDPDGTVVSRVPSDAASKSASVAMAAAAPPNTTCITRRRFVIPTYFVALLAAG
jgi:hypothetical protein